MAQKRFKYLIGILNQDHTVSWVTKIDNSTKTFLCEKGEQAKEFPKTVAESIAEGMCMNFVTAVVVKAPTYCNPYNAGGEDNGES